MKVYLYSGHQTLIEKSGVGRAIYHQQTAAQRNGIELTQNLKEADVIHINTIFPGSLKMSHKARRMGIPVVYHAHSTREDFRNSFLGTNLVDGLFGRWIRKCYESGDLIVTPTPYSKKLLQSYGIQKEIRVISNGIDLDYYKKELGDGQAFRKQYGYTKTQKIIVCVGLTIERKGIRDFVELARRMPEYQFIWFGEVDLHTVPKETRKAVLTKLPNLKFAGYASKDKLRDAYAGSNLFLFPSKEETEGIVVLEALAMKLPVLLRDIPVYSDWLLKNEQVYKASDTDEFEVYTRNLLEGRLQDLTEPGYQAAALRSIEKVGHKLKEAYEEAARIV